MALQSYSVNYEKSKEAGSDVCFLYDLKIPPHGSIREEWTTHGLQHGPAKILFVEYRMEDDDIDGVWEAYGMKRESRYSFTVNAEEADPEKLFVYTLYKDGSLGIGFEIDTEKARAILTFTRPHTITAQQLLTVAEKAENAPRFLGEVEKIVIDELLQGAEDEICLAFFNR